MKKIIVILITAAVAVLVFAGCESRGAQPPETPADYTVVNEENVTTAMQSLAGVWDGMGLSLHIHTDGTWSGGGGDIDLRGNVELTQDGVNYIARFIALEAKGPGAIYDSHGNMREDVFAVNVETWEYFWVPVYNEPFLWFSGRYIVYDDKLLTEDAGGSRYEMERRS